MNMIAKTAFLACVCIASFVNADETEMKVVKFDGKLLCPASEELQNLEATIPPPGTKSANYEEWAENFVASMERLIELVKSEKVGDATFGVDVKAIELVKSGKVGNAALGVDVKAAEIKAVR
jgi:hypothetical protein